METWFLILICLSTFAFLKALFNLFFSSNKPKTCNLPPGPSTLAIILNISWLRLCKSYSGPEHFIRSLHEKLGPMITLHVGSHNAVFISDHSLAHQALIQNGSIFATRPRALAVIKILSCNQHSINSSFYGPTWRLLRRNLHKEILHPSRVKSHTRARRWALEILQDRFELFIKSGEPLRVVDHLQFTMFCLLAIMCFGDKIDEQQIKEIEQVERRMVLNLDKFNVLNFLPGFISNVVFRKRWQQLFQFRKDQEDVLIPLIRARKKLKEETLIKSNKRVYTDESILCYVDTLFDLQLPEEKRQLNEQEMVTLCNEFLNGGTDTTSTTLQWIMANLVKYPQIQEKLFVEIKGVVGNGVEEVQEDDLQKMLYLKAIILEGLRRHPPVHMVSHAVTEDTVLGKYLVPKHGSINFMVADMGWDPMVWEDPMEFKPERFLNNGAETFDITGSRVIKMMPFGAGRRICPAYGLGMLHLEYFLANLVWKYEWKAVDGDDVDFSEKKELTTVMKNPLQVCISPRLKNKD